MDANKMRDTYEAWAIQDAASVGRNLVIDREGDWYIGKDAQFLNLGWASWQASREAVVVELPCLSDELLTAAYWDFDARRKGYPPYAAPAGQECGAFKVAIVSAIEAQGMRVAP